MNHNNDIRQQTKLKLETENNNNIPNKPKHVSVNGDKLWLEALDHSRHQKAEM